MTCAVADELAALAAGGVPLSLDAIATHLDDVVREAPGVAAGPMAPLLAEAVCETEPGPGRDRVVGALVTGLSKQTSVLHLSETVEKLLSGGALMSSHGSALLDSLLHDLSATITPAPILAATRVEFAVRLAIGRFVSPYRVWELLDQLVVLDAPEDFAELLPRTIGAALDIWSGEPMAASSLRRILDELAQLDGPRHDAAYEIGCDCLRAALSASDLDEVTRYLLDARRQLATSTVDEARADAECLMAACDAVLGFARHDAAGVTDATRRLGRVLEQRAAWELRVHQPSWSAPRRSAEFAWQELLLVLDASSRALGDSVWMSPWEALDSVLSAYRAVRTTEPVGVAGGGGLAVLVAPSIENAFLREERILRILERAVERPEEHFGASVFDQPTAIALLAQIRSRRTTASQTPDGAVPNDAKPPDPERVLRLAPSLVDAMGLEKATTLTAALDDEQLSSIGGLAQRADDSRHESDDPVVEPLIDTLIQQLSGHPEFAGHVRTTFIATVRQAVLFLRARLDLTSSSLLGPKADDGGPTFDYRRRPRQDQRVAIESDLQRDFHAWLLAGPLYNCVNAEPTDLALGRGDLILRFGSTRYLAEIKKEDGDASRDHIESTYLVQATEYGNTNAPFGLLLVLDLTDKTSSRGTRRLDELVWVAPHTPTGGTTDRLVVIGVLPGNRVSPSAYSR